MEFPLPPTHDRWEVSSLKFPSVRDSIDTIDSPGARTEQAGTPPIRFLAPTNIEDMTASEASDPDSPAKFEDEVIMWQRRQGTLDDASSSLYSRTPSGNHTLYPDNRTNHTRIDSAWETPLDEGLSTFSSSDYNTLLKCSQYS